MGRQVATAGSSQGRGIEVIAERTGARIGPEKLRHLSCHLAQIMEPQREACQVQQLEEWIDEARKHSKNVTLAVSRDGVSLGNCTVWQLRNGVRRDTERLQRRPANRHDLSGLCSRRQSGNTQSEFHLAAENDHSQSRLETEPHCVRQRCRKNRNCVWKNVLRYLYVDGERIKIQRIVDYYHASLRLTTIADACLLTSSQRTEWLKRVRHYCWNPAAGAE